MLLTKYILLLSSTATFISAATVAQVISDITILDNNVKKLTNVVSTYGGGFIGAFPQLAAIVPVYLSLLQGVTDSGTLPSSLSVDDAYAIINHVNATLAVDNPIAVNGLIAKKPLYQAAGLDDFIVAALGLLELGHESFTFNVLQRIPESASSDGIRVTNIISNALQNGIHVFESK